MYLNCPIFRIIATGSILSLFLSWTGNNKCTSDTYSRNKISSFSTFQDKNQTEGYMAIIRHEDGFIAAGSGGRIDMISSSGSVLKSRKFPEERFNCLLSVSNSLIAAGDNGTIIISDESGKFRKPEKVTNEKINALTFFNGKIIAGADNGEIIYGDVEEPFRKVSLVLKGNIVSLSARESGCYGVTDKGEIIHSADGAKWEISDFNKIYSGYYKPCYFTKILATEDRIAIAGMHDDSTPFLMLSTRGNVWTERPLWYKDDQGDSGYLTGIPNDICYDDTGDEFFLACNNGTIFRLPSCSQCNKLQIIAKEDLEAIASDGINLIIAGANFLLKKVNLR